MAAFVFVDNVENQILVYGSLPRLSREQKIPIDTLYDIFSRRKLTDYKSDRFRIVKTEIRKGGR